MTKKAKELHMLRGLVHILKELEFGSPQDIDEALALAI